MTPAIKIVALLCATMLLISVQGSPSPYTEAKDNALPTESRFLKKLWKSIKKTVKKAGKKVTKGLVCNKATKAAFGTAFAAAVAVPAKFNCRSMTAAEWAKVGCSSPASHRKTLICAPAVWGGVLGKVIKADAMALKTKILFRNGISRHSLFYTSKGRALMRHELTHIRQQAGVSSYKWGYRYMDAYCDAGRSYSNNRFEKEARTFQNDIC
eukprot:Plantae.Rhodophyta-Palmaria_palmata.ctg7707.p1 GENE.Plantae.Rhodophyta-Palmaria_palmata.ctg7707~~Plantae.Rhodophyta-Palmaria_palmata.ctg7707.p1  ORF type:complete len:211 (+),score=23.21 Plantae.Rhodophyta-Palmaria_palmata.ctg7707:38-670(+)